MKTLVLSALLAVSGMAFANEKGEGYNARLKEAAAQKSEWIYLAHTSHYTGAGYLKTCKKVLAYEGGPKSGNYKTYYLCKVAY